MQQQHKTEQQSRFNKIPIIFPPFCFYVPHEQILWVTLERVDIQLSVIEWHRGCWLCLFCARCYDYISSNCTCLLCHTDGPLHVGGIKTEHTLNSSAAYRMQTARHWHEKKKNNGSRDLSKRLCQGLIEHTSFVRDAASCWCPEQRAPFPPPRLQSNLASRPLAPGFMSAMSCGRRPRTPKPARCEGQKHTQTKPDRKSVV